VLGRIREGGQHRVYLDFLCRRCSLWQFPRSSKSRGCHLMKRVALCNRFTSDHDEFRGDSSTDETRRRRPARTSRILSEFAMELQGRREGSGSKPCSRLYPGLGTEADLYNAPSASMTHISPLTPQCQKRSVVARINI
jgi:hypothetical protein